MFDLGAGLADDEIADLIIGPVRSRGAAAGGQRKAEKEKDSRCFHK
jgi:hypothetical protein